jgi:hypothetical protein
VLNLLFRCRHRRLTRPVAPISKPGQPQSRSYVVCLDCGKQFEYDAHEMRLGKPIDPRNTAVMPPNMPDAQKKKVKLAFFAVPATFLLGLFLKSRKR